MGWLCLKECRVLDQVRNSQSTLDCGTNWCLEIWSLLYLIKGPFQATFRVLHPHNLTKPTERDVFSLKWSSLVDYFRHHRTNFYDCCRCRVSMFLMHLMRLLSCRMKCFTVEAAFSIIYDVGHYIRFNETNGWMEIHYPSSRLGRNSQKENSF